MSKTYTHKIPIKAIRNAIQAVSDLHAEYTSLDETRRELNPDGEALEKYVAQFGEYGLKMLENKREQLQKHEQELQEAARQIVEKARQEYQKEVSRLYTVDASQLMGDNAAALAILQNGLIESPAELKAFMEKHSENPALMRLADRYATDKAGSAANSDPGNPFASNQWEKLHAENNTERAIRSLDDVFNTCLEAINSPGGYSAMLVSNPGYELETMKNHDCLEEYSFTCPESFTGSGDDGSEQ